MKLNVKKMSSFLVVLDLLIFTTSFICSCSSDEYELSRNITNANLTTVGSELKSKSTSFRTDIVDSIAESDEFLDFIMCCNMLSDKFDACFSTLSNEEKVEWRDNINNSDYMDDFAKKADIDAEVRLIVESKKKMFNNTAYLTLNEFEKSVLYFDRIPLADNVLVKTRSESDSSECEKNRQDARNAAYSSFYFSVGACGNNSQCLAEADGVLRMNLNFADVNYYNCMENISK